MSGHPIRIGRINYTNVWPIFYHFPIERFHNRVELVQQVPAQLNRAMADGTVAMGPISSFAYGEHSDEYVLLPDLSVSAWGKVNSILLFHRRPLQEIADGKVALANTSATSTNLLKIILEHFHHGKPQYTSCDPCLEEMMREADAALLIGDDAIKAGWTDHGYQVTDLGEEWNRLTGHWMSFAVWAIREDEIDRHPELIKEIYESFVESKRKGLSDPSGMIGQAVAAIGGTQAYWKQYFGQLTYDFGPAQWAGLAHYFGLAAELGLLRSSPRIRIWGENTVTQVKE
ncbi:MAG: transporter substrate-binding protein [Paenibacillaceae bacterium]|jgi:chorismate dehydratase|nr:transporter substrate-binding protein [Paenibacillaceae bacterium]